MKNFIFSILQFLLLLYLFLSGPLYIFSITFVLILIISLLLILWAALVKKLHKHPVSPRAPRGTYMITNGPYEIVRHPIYAGLLLFVINYSQGYHSIFQYLAFLPFLALILMRIRRDEELTERFFKHEYSAYKKQAKKLIPYIY